MGLDIVGSLGLPATEVAEIGDAVDVLPAGDGADGGGTGGETVSFALGAEPGCDQVGDLGVAVLAWGGGGCGDEKVVVCVGD
jgi:hypothetical protein